MTEACMYTNILNRNIIDEMGFPAYLNTEMVESQSSIRQCCSQIILVFVK
jgi:hypothetical protein